MIKEFHNMSKLLAKGIKNPKRGCRYLFDTLTHPRIYKTVNHVEGWISLRTAVLLFDAVISNRHRPGEIIEVGAFKGLSTCVLSIAANRVGKRVKCFELFTGLPTANPQLDGIFQKGMFASTVEEYERNVKTYGCRDCVDLIIGDARETLEVNGEDGFSVAFVDTDVYEVTKDVLARLLHVAKGGEIIIVHDYCSPGIEKAIGELRNSCAFDLLAEKVEKDDMTIQYRLLSK